MTLIRLRRMFINNLPWIIIAIGIILRLRQYGTDRSLWVDEAFLARNIIERSFVGLLQPLGYLQNAPVGFMLITKLATIIGGTDALVLRFFPLVFGIIALFFFYRVARHFLRTPGALVALTFFSLSVPMVYYSGEFKQYTGDVCATLLLWYFFLVARPKKSIWLAAIGAVVPWFSHASLFILTGLAFSDVTLWKYAVPIWIASFGADYLFFLRHNLAAVIIDNWQGHFLVFPWLQSGNTAMYVRSIGTMFGFFVAADSTWAHALVLGIGYFHIVRKNVKNIFIFVLPILLLFIATGFQKYPFVPRLLLFLAPSLYIAIGAGVDLLIARIGRKVVLILLPVLLWGIIPSAASALVIPIKIEELSQVMSYLHRHYQPDDIIYLYYAAESPFRVYALKYGLDNAHVVVGIESRKDITRYLNDVSKLKGNPRVWVVFSHVYRQSFFGEDLFIADYLDNIGKRLDYYPQVGASLYLYDLR